MKYFLTALLAASLFPTLTFADSVTLTIRNGDTVFYSGSVPLPDATAPAVSMTATGDSTAHDVPALSLTGTLYALDLTENGFSLSNLVYYPSFGSFYIKCITGTSELCDNWQYYVNGSAPSAGADATILKDGDVVYVYYGSPSRTTLSKTAASTGEDFTATAEKYDPVSNTFSPRSSVTVGITGDPFAFPVVTATSSLSDSSGKATFYMNTAGHYEVGVAEDYYFPTTGIDITEPASVSVKLRVETATTTLFSGSVSVPACSTTANDRKTLNGFCSFDAARVAHAETWSAFGALVTSIADQEAGVSYWTLFVNNEPSDRGIASYVPNTNDELLWVLDIPPMKLATASTTMLSGATTTITSYGFDFNDFAYKPLVGASIEGLATTTDASGTVLFTATSTATLSLSATKSGYLKSNTVGITTSAAPVVTPPSSGGNGGGGGSNPKPVFSVSRALGFILGFQKPDGSFGAQSFTDWVSIALATQADSTALQKLKTYQASAVVSPATVLDLERHALALESLNINPHTAPMNPIAAIISNFDGTQIGDSGQDNDDIFAVFPLLKAGYAPSDPMMQKIAAAIMAAQRKDGSWDGSADMTGAAVQALGAFFGPSGVDQRALGKALGMATGYLASKQQNDGGWTNGLSSDSNSDSTSWVLLSINATTEADPSRASSWQTSSGNTPPDYLGGAQQSDGGVRPLADSPDMRLWSTSYALSAATGKSWLSIPRSFPKPATGGGIGGSGGGSNATTTVATSSVAAATSTEATSTPTVATSSELMIATATIATTTPSTTTAPMKKKIVLRKPAPKVTSPVEPLPRTPTTTPPENSQTAAAARSQPSLIISIFHFFVRMFGF